MNVLTSGILEVGFHLKISFKSFHDMSQPAESRWKREPQSDSFIECGRNNLDEPTTSTCVTYPGGFLLCFVWWLRFVQTVHSVSGGRHVKGLSEWHGSRVLFFRSEKNPPTPQKSLTHRPRVVGWKQLKASPFLFLYQCPVKGVTLLLKKIVSPSTLYVKWAVMRLLESDMKDAPVSSYWSHDGWIWK